MANSNVAPRDNKLFNNMTQFTEKLAIYGQTILPHHLLSRCIGWLARCQWSWVKNTFIAWFVKRYGVDMQDAEQQDPYSYPNFNSFFTRKLLAGARPFAGGYQDIACPIDGFVSQIGRVHEDKIFQAKKFDFHLEQLLGGSKNRAAAFAGGSFATLYLSPKDYHRVHMPFAGTLREMVHVPGRLFSVNPLTVRNVPGLFARNERVISIFDTKLGPMAVIMVGAMIVASISTVWVGEITPPHGRSVREWQYQDKKIALKLGEEMGHFMVGSTVIILFAANSVDWIDNIRSGDSVKLGQVLGVGNVTDKLFV